MLIETRQSSDPADLLSHRARPDARRPQGPSIWDKASDDWDAEKNPSGYVNLRFAENGLMHSEVIGHITQNLKPDSFSLTYGNGPLGTYRLRQSLAKFLNRKLGPHKPLKLEHVAITNGASSSVEHASWAIADPGDAILLGRPFYHTFLQDMGHRPDVEIIQVAFGDVDPMSQAAVRSYEHEFLEARKRGVAARAIMLCNPHNPLGRCYTREAILGLLRLCQKYQVHLICDEIYALSVWENTRDNVSHNPFHSILSFDLDSIINPALIHVIWGVSKDFGSNGLRLGCIISQNNPAMLQALGGVGLYTFASSLSDQVVANLLEDDSFVDKYIETNQRRLSQSYNLVVDFLKENDIEHAPGANAAFFLWVNLGKAYRKRHPVAKDKDDVVEVIVKALAKEKVLVAEGSQLGSEVPGFFRIVFSQPPEYVKEGLRRMLAAIVSG